MNNTNQRLCKTLTIIIIPYVKYKKKNNTLYRKLTIKMMPYISNVNNKNIPIYKVFIYLNISYFWLFLVFLVFLFFFWMVVSSTVTSSSLACFLFFFDFSLLFFFPWSSDDSVSDSRSAVRFLFRDGERVLVVLLPGVQVSVRYLFSPFMVAFALKSRSALESDTEFSAYQSGFDRMVFTTV